jgi:DNA-directed RNA polymerase specialized sigma24 family protein
MQPARPLLRESDSRNTQFDRLLQHLHPERDGAGEVYEDMRRRLNKFFQWNHCSPAEDLTDAVLDRVAEKLASEEIHNIIAFAWGVARNLAHEFHKRPITISMEDLPPSQHPHTGHTEVQLIHDREAERRLECLRQCIQELSSADCALFLEYPYYKGDDRILAALADRMQLSVQALQARAHRLKARVKECVSRRLHAPRSGQRIPSNQSRLVEDTHGE